MARLDALTAAVTVDVDLQVAALHPDDTVLLTVKRSLTAGELEAMSDYLADVFPGVVFVIVSEAEMAVQHPEDRP